YMTNIGEFYKCNVCGNFVEVVENGAGELTCCGQAMELMEIQTEGEKAPKHAPVVEIDGNKVTVCVGEVQHPMDDDHYIQFIELTVGDEKYLKQLKPGDEPKATFIVDAADDVVAKALCNLHGLWSN
ncbi:MAG: desulfoferrodoxin, partial [Methanobrevibacter woesei]|nr:desulfoferrodoxin [Methanobrevibacter woesei]